LKPTFFKLKNAGKINLIGDNSTPKKSQTQKFAGLKVEFLFDFVRL
jgi:hypothetical protein